MANFEAFLQSIKLSVNLFFLKSGHIAADSKHQMQQTTTSQKPNYFSGRRGHYVPNFFLKNKIDHTSLLRKHLQIPIVHGLLQFSVSFLKKLTFGQIRHSHCTMNLKYEVISSPYNSKKIFQCFCLVFFSKLTFKIDNKVCLDSTPNF